MHSRIALGVALVVCSACGGSGTTAGSKAPSEPAPPVSEAPARPAHAIRLVGVVEAVRAYSVAVPRLRGQSNAPLTLTLLARGGSRVEQGAVVAEIDPQDQERVARDRRSTVLNLEQQIRKLEADQAAAKASDDTEMTVASSDVERARLTVGTNHLLPKLEAEKNSLQLEQMQARLEELRKTYDLKRLAAKADLRILEIRRDRAKTELEYAEQNVELMVMSAPFAGLVVPKTNMRNGQMVEVQEGDEARAGMPILDVVDASSMRVRLRVNQGDIASMQVGQSARVFLDAYPELSFKGRIEQIAPVAVPSSLTPTVRTFLAFVSIDGTHDKLMPDLTAAVEIDTGPEPERDADDADDAEGADPIKLSPPAKVKKP